MPGLTRNLDAMSHGLGHLLEILAIAGMMGLPSGVIPGLTRNLEAASDSLGPLLEIPAFAGMTKKTTRSLVMPTSLLP